ncbi:MAG TPA: hypothetical protein VFT32_07305 [Candidatus Eisenbacteria bacterium]|nr:hypothetical protein [Candidatus Eisenbacteria bacterium]
MNFFTKVILGSVAVLLAAAGAVLLFRSGEAARVDALIREAVGWAARGETERVEELIDDDFEGGAEAARLEIRRRTKLVALDKLEVIRLKVGASGDQANATIELRVQYRDIPLLALETFHVELRKRGEVWRVISVKRPEGRKR